LARTELAVKNLKRANRARGGKRKTTRKLPGGNFPGKCSGAVLARGEGKLWENVDAQWEKVTITDGIAKFHKKVASGSGKPGDFACQDGRKHRKKQRGSNGRDS